MRKPTRPHRNISYPVDTTSFPSRPGLSPSHHSLPTVITKSETMPSLALYQTSISPSALRSTAKPTNPKAKSTTQFYSTKTKLHHHHHHHHRKSLSSVCRASSSSWTADFDLYEILGVEFSSDQSQIKAAYRSLQKRCHPDIAGPAGHDMAIVLNEIYSILSDPTSRSAYDRVSAGVFKCPGPCPA